MRVDALPVQARQLARGLQKCADLARQQAQAVHTAVDLQVQTRRAGFLDATRVVLDRRQPSSRLLGPLTTLDVHSAGPEKAFSTRPFISDHIDDYIDALRTTRDGRLLVAKSRVVVSVMDAATGRVVRQIRLEPDCRASLDLSPDGRLAVSAGADGTLRLSTPNLEWVWATHGLGDPATTPAEVRAERTLVANRAFYGWQHRFLWSRPLLEAALAACGFDRIRFFARGESADPALAGIEQHEAYPDAPGLPHVLVVEASPGRYEPGLHATLWDLRRSLTAPRPPQQAQAGPGRRGQGLLSEPVLPGTYRVVLTVDGKEYIQAVRVEADPTVPAAVAAPEDLPGEYEREEKRPDRRD